MRKKLLRFLLCVFAAQTTLDSFAARFVDRLAAGDRQTVVCYGTSLTAISKAWVDDLRAALDERFPGQATVINAGLSGKNSATGLAEVQRRVCAQNPDAVLIEFAMNDAADTLNAGRTPAESLASAETNLKAIIKALRAANPEVEIILQTMNAYTSVPGSKLSNRTGLADHIAMYRRVAQTEGYLLIDNYPIWERILEADRNQYLKLVPDGVHPNAAGAARVTTPNVLATLGVGEIEFARDLPVLTTVDVLVVGGTFAGVAAAVAAKEAGASVFLVSPRRNPGEEIVVPRRLLLSDDDEPLPAALAGRLAPSKAGSTAPRRPLTPLVYEQALDAQLLANGIRFLSGTMPCGVARDEAGRLAGVVIANRSGRQVVRAKTVIDATDKGVVARLAAPLRPVDPRNEVSFTFHIMAKRGLVFTCPGYTVTTGPATRGSVTLYTNDNAMIPADAQRTYDLEWYSFTRSFPLTTGAWPAVNAITQRMKTDCWTKSLVDASEVPDYVTPDRIVGETAVTDWTSSAAVPEGAFKPAGVDGLFVLGEAADIDRALASRLTRPGVASALGARFGRRAAAVAAARTVGSSVTVGHPAKGVTARRVCEANGRPRGIGLAATTETVRSRGDDLPVLAVADIAVVGVGTAGVPAALAALGKGRSVVGLEFLHTTGGVTTDGGIGKYYRGNNRGFTRTTVNAGTLAKGWVYSRAKAEWARSSIVTNANAQILFGSLVTGVLTGGTDAAGRAKVTGVVAVLPDGTRGVVRAKVILDCTGNADIAHLAGCETMFLDGGEFAMQGSGTSYHDLGNSYANTDFGFSDTGDAGDLSNFALRARLGAKAGRFNVGDPTTTSRERRRIIGDVVVNERDILRDRTWSDTIMRGTSDYDMHGYSVSDALMYRERKHGTPFSANLPYRALIPARLTQVLATGLGISATRDAMPIIRMQRDVENQGYAAGLAAAAAVAGACDVRAIDVKALQRALVAAGNLDARVLTDTDATVTDAELAAAVRNISADLFVGIEKILERSSDAHPLLLAAYGAATNDARRIALACSLVLVGDNVHLDDVIAAAKTADWSKGRDFQGLGNYGRQTAPVDYLIYTLVRSGDAVRVVPVLAGLADRLVSEKGTVAKLSHFRMITFAIEELKSREIYEALLKAMARGAKLTGYAEPEAANLPAHDVSSGSGNNEIDDLERTRSLIEITLARTLSRVGNAEGQAILDSYRNDARTIYAAYVELARALEPIQLKKLNP